MGKKAAKKDVEPPKAEEKTQEEEEEDAPAPAARAPEPEAPAAAAAVEDAVDEVKDRSKADVIHFTPEAAVQYDLTAKMTPYLDPHLILPILNFLQEVGMYNVEDVTRAEIKILSGTCLIDLAIDKYDGLDDEVPESLMERREEVIGKLANMRDQVMDLLQILESEESVKRIQQFKSLDEMCREVDLHPEVVGQLAEYAKLKFDCGDYNVSSMLLKHYRMFLAHEPISSKYVSCCWGSLACGLLNPEFEGTIDFILKLDELLENTKAPKREVLLHRTWLLHWTLFAIFSPHNSDKATDQQWPKILEFFLKESSLSIISLSCPHLFRYVGACLILQKRLKHLVSHTVWIINNESGTYSDPVTRFLLALYTEMDFDDAQRELQKCELVCKGDHFLAPHWTALQENARLHIFESYCRTHQCINIQMIASKLNMEAVEAELWIVKLIQNAKLDARIDSEKSRVVMTKAPPNVYQQVIEKTKNLAFRSTMLVSNLEKR